MQWRWLTYLFLALCATSAFLYKCKAKIRPQIHNSLLFCTICAFGADKIDVPVSFAASFRKATFITSGSSNEGLPQTTIGTYKVVPEKQSHKMHLHLKQPRNNQTTSLFLTFDTHHSGFLECLVKDGQTTTLQYGYFHLCSTKR